MTSSGPPPPGYSLCDIWAFGYEIVQQHTGQTLWSHQYGHNNCPFNDKQAAATHTLQLRLCVFLRPSVPLAPLGSRNIQPKRGAEGVQVDPPVQWPVLVPQQAQSMHPGDGWERDR